MSVPVCPACGGDLLITPGGWVTCLKRCPEPKLTREQRKALEASDAKIQAIPFQVQTYGKAVKKFFAEPQGE